MFVKHIRMKWVEYNEIMIKCDEILTDGFKMFKHCDEPLIYVKSHILLCHKVNSYHRRCMLGGIHKITSISL